MLRVLHNAGHMVPGTFDDGTSLAVARWSSDPEARMPMASQVYKTEGDCFLC